MILAAGGVLRLNLLKHEKKCHLWKNKSLAVSYKINIFLHILCIRIFFALSVRRSLLRCSIGKNITNGGFYNIIFCTVFPFKNTHYGMGEVFQIEFCKWRLYLCVCTVQKEIIFFPIRFYKLLISNTDSDRNEKTGIFFSLHNVEKI